MSCHVATCKSEDQAYMNVILTPAGVGASVHCLHYSEKKMPAYQSRCMHGMLPPCLRCAIQGTDPYIPQETREKLGCMHRTL
jgi:hypothetical protein